MYFQFSNLSQQNNNPLVKKFLISPTDGTSNMTKNPHDISKHLKDKFIGKTDVNLQMVLTRAAPDPWHPIDSKPCLYFRPELRFKEALNKNGVRTII